MPKKRKSPKRSSLGRAEAELLQYIVDHAPISVGEVAKHAAAHGGLARTTVQTMMERLREKGYLTRKKTDGVNLYSPQVEKPELMKQLVSDFVSGVLGGSLSPFVAYLHSQSSVDEEQLKKLKKVVAELEDRRHEGED